MLDLLDNLTTHFNSKENLVTLIIEHNEKLLDFMLNSKLANEYKKHFFEEIAGSLVFKEKALLEVLENKELNNSYTRFKNKIGLTKKGHFLQSSELVVLNFPFKDNILLGNAKDNNTKSNELFYHEILHKNEIESLLNQKVLCNFEMHGHGDLENALKDKNTNYLIKGNNLIALHSLKKKFAKQVKCIYIDPPYNTGNDSFNYNDNFNHSSWLVFMKNRLEIAKEFLKDNGVIFVQCDDNEQAYLKVLMDEVFGRDNFVSCITMLSSTPSGVKTAHRNKTIIKTKDYLLVYAKNSLLIQLKPQYKEATTWDTHFNLYFDREHNRVFPLSHILRQNGLYEKLKATQNYLNDKDFCNFIYSNADKIFQTGKSLPERIRAISLKTENKDIPIKYESDTGIQYAYNGRRMSFLSRSIHSVLSSQGIEQKIAILLCDFWNDIDFNNTQNEGSVSFPSGKKPEQLIYRILDMVTNENDLVLDFFAGSGTTCAVAHKMNRRYIGIEQMDYIETITKERLKKVIEGEQGGISKKLNFKGGGSFVYCELKEVNLKIKKDICNATNSSECLEIFNTLSERILKRIDCDMHALTSEEFKTLSLDEQKEILCNLLDSNEDYLNLGDIDESTWEIDTKTKQYNKLFYSK
ncbi:site-specific DNA-methyltransferase [Helicobacter cetorum]|uniref:site-specific DNA-methyltransferase (adenine-specific) n=1 Tax=Helicobacter cetorum (strain ATCC BAA-429 / MIT 00-7128) TaxID=182217 RepID=I0EPQ4_HELC0|nr:site-specific DNA-methyltransferase [Helicobacter cetorum]AFI04923.1 type III restriction-modification system: methyltransferase [Helicobacter cetorum MIT 00-7128]